MGRHRQVLSRTRRWSGRAALAAEGSRGVAQVGRRWGRTRSRLSSGWIGEEDEEDKESLKNDGQGQM